MFRGIFSLIHSIIDEFVNSINEIFYFIFLDYGYNPYILDETINLSLFSDNVIFSIPLIDLITFITTTILLVIIIKFLIKSTKKFITMVFGVFRV